MTLTEDEWRMLDRKRRIEGAGRAAVVRKAIAAYRPISKVTGEEAESCEGCSEEATTADSVGVPLCDDCLAELVEATAFPVPEPSVSGATGKPTRNRP
jgi:hypothetical protein